MASPKLEDFEMLKVLGKGSYGKVVLVKRKGASANEVYAMKMLRKDHIVKRNQVEHTQAERSVLQIVKHPFIVELHAAFQTPKKLHFVLEFCAGGELFFHLSRAGRFSEGRTKFYACEILLALEYLHNLNIIYRDLKPENLLLDHEGHAKITDFGLSKEGIMDNVSAKTMCGTPEYLAPEILRKEGHGKAVDWYSFGALIYEMLTGLPPYYTKDRNQLFENIKRGNLKFPSYVTAVSKDVCEQLLHREPNKRLGGGRGGGDDVKRAAFFAGQNFDEIYAKGIVPPFKPDVSGPADTKYFDKEFTNMPAVNSEVQGGADVKKFEGFTYAAK